MHNFIFVIISALGQKISRLQKIKRIKEKIQRMKEHQDTEDALLVTIVFKDMEYVLLYLNISKTLLLCRFKGPATKSKIYNHPLIQSK